MKVKKYFKEILSFFYFFTLVAFVTTCTLGFFINILSKTLGYEFTKDDVHKSAILTFIVVIFISSIFTLIDYTRRQITVIRPTREIQSCLNKLTKGDFSSRVQLTVAESFFGDIANC